MESHQRCKEDHYEMGMLRHWGWGLHQCLERPLGSMVTQVQTQAQIQVPCTDSYCGITTHRS